MKNLLFVIPSLKTGGIEQSMINLLHAIPPGKYNIQVFVFHYDPKYVDYIPKSINIIHGNKILDIYGMTREEAKSVGVITYIVRLLMAAFCKVIGSNLLCTYIFRTNRVLDGYDMVVSYSNNITNCGVYFGCNKYVLNNICAKKKITWLHVDYEAMRLENDINRNEYLRFDKIVCVSESVRSSFLKYYPEMDKQTVTIHNIISIEDELYCGINVDRDTFNIVTVGRLDPNKNQIEAISILKKLVMNHPNIKWWFIGDGQDRIQIEKRIIDYNLENNAVVVGYRNDAIGFVKECDLFVSLSLSESYGMSIAEALMVGTPVVVHYYPAVKELINNGNGIVVKNYNEMFDAIEMLIRDKKVYERLKNRTAMLNDSDVILKKLFMVIEGE